MKVIIRNIILFCFLSIGLNAQYISSITIPDPTIPVVMDSSDMAYVNALTITKEDLRKHLTIIASDEFQGRETGEEGNDKAAAYIAGELERIGIDPIMGDSYFQKVDFKWISWKDVSITVGEQKFKHLWDFLSFPDKNTDLKELITDEVIFLGYGIEDENYSDYKRANIKGKVIMINEGEPENEDGKYIISGSGEPSVWTTEPDKKLELAYEKGAKAVLIITQDIQAKLAENRRKLLSPSVIIGSQEDKMPAVANSCYISSNIAKEIIGDNAAKILKARQKIAKKGKSKGVKLKTDVKIVQDRSDYNLAGNNILGYIEGSDKKEELVIVSAHYDHVGMKGDDIFNGADDNGSGTTAILEMAEAFAIAKENGNGPRRSILFLWVTGEEKGLLGSDYYTQFPVFPLETTLCNINIDMVGRVDNKYEEMNNPNYIYVIGSDRISKDLHQVNEEANDEYSRITLDYTYNAEEDPNRFYFRSDHYNFAKNGIPSIFFFNGVHADYHRTTDTVEKIHFEKMEKVTRHIFHLAWKLANQEAKLTLPNGKV